MARQRLVLVSEHCGILDWPGLAEGLFRIRDGEDVTAAIQRIARLSPVARKRKAELAFERSGPERYMSAFTLIEELVRAVSQDPSERGAAAVGRIIAHLATLRSMSLSVAGKLQAGEDPALDGSVVKDLGAVFEQSIPVTAQPY